MLRKKVEKKLTLICQSMISTIMLEERLNNLRDTGGELNNV